MIITKQCIRCKFEIDEKVMEQVMHFYYLGSKIISDGRRAEEVKTQTYKTARVAGYLRDIIYIIHN